MYVSEIINATAQSFYPQPLLFDPIPPNLYAYYENHWHKIIQLSNVATSEFKQGTIEISVINTLAKQENPIKVEAIA